MAPLTSQELGGGGRGLCDTSRRQGRTSGAVGPTRLKKQQPSFVRSLSGAAVLFRPDPIRASASSKQIAFYEPFPAASVSSGETINSRNCLCPLE